MTMRKSARISRGSKGHQAEASTPPKAKPEPAPKSGGVTIGKGALGKVLPGR